MSYVGLRQPHKPSRSLRGMITVGLFYAMILGAITLVIAWLPMAGPEKAQSQSSALRLPNESVSRKIFDPAIDMAPHPQWHVASEPATFAMPGITQITTPPIAQLTTAMTYNGRPLRPVKTLSMLVTAYSPDERSCGKWADGITASGYSVWTNAGKLVAADTHLLPFGTLLTIPGYHGGKPVPVLDRGGKIKGQRLDVLYPTHAIARRWGAQKLKVTVWEYAD